MIAFLCAGGHAQDIAADMGSNHSGPFEFFDDDPDKGYPPIDSAPPGPYVIGINDCRQRRAIADRIRHLGFGPGLAWIHAKANVPRQSWHDQKFSVGRHTHINAGVFIARSTLGQFCTVSPNATICGDCTIGDLVTIGAGATVCEFCVIGDGATIAAGAVLPPHTNVPCNETWGGVPARRLS